jgi:PAS domain S-box-containing protein
MATNHSPPLDVALTDVLDIAAFQNLTDSFSRLTGIATAILDIKGKILVASGWQPICTEFHRKNPFTAQRCLESDTALANQLAQGKKYNVYQCKNGLVDVAAPIILDNRHVGNIFAGQFFFAPPDIDFFLRQAEQFDFAKDEYLRMLSHVPVIAKGKMRQIMNFLTDLTTILGNSAIDKKELLHLNKHLERLVQARTHELKEEMRFSDSLINSLPGVMYLFDQSGKFKRWNMNFEKVTGFSAEQLVLMSPLDFIATEDKSRVKEAIDTVFRDGWADVEAGFSTGDGRVLPYLFTGYRFTQDLLNYLVGIGLNISDRVRVEQERESLIASLQESLKKVKQLSGFLPICASCKKIRDDEGYWNQIEWYIREHSEVEFSHGICPDCARKLYPNLKFPKR